MGGSGYKKGRVLGSVQMPVLRGLPLVIFLAVWGVMLATALLTNAAALPDTISRATVVSPEAMIGLQLKQAPEGFVLGSPMGKEAVAAGIQGGERLVAVDGKPVPLKREALDSQLAGPTGTTVRIEVANKSGTTRIIPLARNSRHQAEAYAEAWLSKPLFTAIYGVLIYGLDVLFPLACGIVLLARRLRDPFAPWASLMMVTVAAGVGEGLFWIAGLPPPWPTVATALNNVAFMLFILVFALFPSGRLDSRWAWAVLVATPAVYLLTWDWLAEWGNVFNLFLLAMALMAVRTRYRVMPDGTARRQVRWAMVGFVGGLLGLGLMTGAQLGRRSDPGMAAELWLELLNIFAGALALVLMFGAMTISLLRYRLYDADTVISRSLAYGALTLGMLGIFAGSEKAIEVLGDELFGAQIGRFAGAAGAALAAIMLVPFHHRLTHWAEQRFRKPLVLLRHGLPLLVGDLRETESLPHIASAALERLIAGVHATHAALLVQDEICAARGTAIEQIEEWRANWTPRVASGIDCVRDDSLFPMRVPLDTDDHGRVGWLLLGSRPDGSFYDKDEREVIADVADPVARAIRIVRIREAREAAQAKEIRLVRAEVTRLRNQLADKDPATARLKAR